MELTQRPAVPRWRRALRAAWLVAVVVVVGIVLADRRSEVGAALGSLSPGALAGSMVAALVAVGVTGQLWRTLLAGLGAPLPVGAALRVFFVGQLGKYLPGSVWPLLAQVEMGRDHEVPGRVSAAGLVLFLWVHLCTGAIVAALFLPWLGWPPAVALAALPGLLLLLPRPLGAVLNRGLRLLRREPLPRLPGRAAMARATAWAGLAWLGYGIHVQVLARGIGTDQAGEVGLGAAIGAFAAAWVAGFVFLVAPAGAGLREGVLVALLPLGTAPALAVALVSRLLVTAADVLWALAGLAAPGRPRP